MANPQLVGECPDEQDLGFLPRDLAVKSPANIRSWEVLALWADEYASEALLQLSSQPQRERERESAAISVGLGFRPSSFSCNHEATLKQHKP